MYFKIRFAQAIMIIDQIYQTIGNEFFEIKVELIEVALHSTYDIRFNKFHQNYPSSAVYLEFLYDFVSEYTSKKEIVEVNCDHVFFIHNVAIDNALGFAFLKEICPPSRFVSAEMYTPHLETVMAHELAHNLGSNHDTQTEPIYKSNCTNERFLMYPSAAYVESQHILSKCTIEELKKVFLISLRI